jgi:hypothetical protein
MEMACNAFLKICKSTGEQFTIVQQHESEPFIKEILLKMPEVTKKFTSDAFQFIFY